MDKLKTFIKSLELRLSDLFFLIAIVPFVILAAFTTTFMNNPDPANCTLTLPAIIACFVICLIGYAAYFVLEKKRGNLKINLLIPLGIVLAIIGVIAIVIQPSSLTQEVICRNVNSTNEALWPGIQIGDVISTTTTISDLHKIFFALYIPLVFITLFAIFFVLPKRFKTVNFVKYICFIGFAALAVIIIYSYITEYSVYIPCLKAIFSGADSIPTVQSFLGHRNAYGMAMLLGMIFAFIAHSFNKKWYYYLIAAFFYINMIFSFCKTSIIIGALIFIIYIYFRLIYAYKDNAKRNKILLIVYSSIILICVGVVGISLITQKGFIYGLIKNAEDGGTLTLRRYVWDNTFQAISGGNIVIGRGFGTVNEILLSMNIVNGDVVFLTHNAFVAMLSEGGLIFLFAYVGFLVYSGYIIVKNFKKNMNLMAALSLGILTFFIYSLIESNYYIIYILMIPILTFDQIEKRKEIVKQKN